MQEGSAQPPTPQTEYDIPLSLLDEWQSIVDLMAEIIDIPVGLIMRAAGKDVEVLLSSQTQGNPYHAGEKEQLWGSGLYCEAVIQTMDKLLVPNALASPEWDQNPDLKLNMIAYLGLPIRLPDGKAFGTICVLDNKENAFGSKAETLLAKLRDILESNLAMVYMNHVLEEKNRGLMDYINEIKTLRGLIPICAKCKKIRDSDDYWHAIEDYISQHTQAQFTHSLCPECIDDLYPDWDSPR